MTDAPTPGAPQALGALRIDRQGMAPDRRRRWRRWVALAIYVAAAITDFFDGYLARRWQQQSSLGRMLDPIADKVLVAVVLLVMHAVRHHADEAERLQLRQLAFWHDDGERCAIRNFRSGEAPAAALQRGHCAHHQVRP